VDGNASPDTTTLALSPGAPTTPPPLPSPWPRRCVLEPLALSAIKATDPVSEDPEPRKAPAGALTDAQSERAQAERHCPRRKAPVHRAAQLKASMPTSMCYGRRRSQRIFQRHLNAKAKSKSVPLHLMIGKGGARRCAALPRRLAGRALPREIRRCARTAGVAFIEGIQYSEPQQHRLPSLRLPPAARAKATAQKEKLELLAAAAACGKVPSRRSSRRSISFLSPAKLCRAGVNVYPATRHSEWSTSRTETSFATSPLTSASSVAGDLEPIIHPVRRKRTFSKTRPVQAGMAEPMGRTRDTFSTSRQQRPSDPSSGSASREPSKPLARRRLCGKTCWPSSSQH